MSDFEILNVQYTHGKNAWKASHTPDANWIYVLDGFEGNNGEIYPSKSKAGNPYMIRVHKDNIVAFSRFISEIAEKLHNNNTSVNEQDDTSADTTGDTSGEESDLPF